MNGFNTLFTVRSIIVPLFSLSFALVSHIPQVVTFLPCHKLRIMSGDLGRPPLAEIIKRVSHRSLLFVVGMVLVTVVPVVPQVAVVTQYQSLCCRCAAR